MAPTNSLSVLIQLVVVPQYVVSGFPCNKLNCLMLWWTWLWKTVSITAWSLSWGHMRERRQEKMVRIALFVIKKLPSNAWTKRTRCDERDEKLFQLCVQWEVPHLLLVCLISLLHECPVQADSAVQYCDPSHVTIPYENRICMLKKKKKQQKKFMMLEDNTERFSGEIE